MRNVHDISIVWSTGILNRMRHSCFLKAALGVCLSVSVYSCGISDENEPLFLLSEVGVGYSSTSVNTTSFRNSSITTFGDTQYIAYYDSDGYMVIGKRMLGEKKWQTRRSDYKGNCADAHNVISLGVDGDGYLHVSFDQHGQKLKYCVGLEPGSLELSGLRTMTDSLENSVTYPEFHRLNNGDMLFVYRDGSSGNGNMVINHYDLKSKKWSMAQSNLIDGEGDRNAYWQMCVDRNDVLHVSWTWRESYKVETNHDICYAKSYDKGKTWVNSSGSQYDLPINISNAEIICLVPQNSELINQTCMAVDTIGGVYIATYWRDRDNMIPQYRLIWNKGDGWRTTQVGDRTRAFTLSGGGTKKIPISRPKIAVVNDNDKTKVFYICRDEEFNNRALLYMNEDLNNDASLWKRTDMTSFSLEAWEPSYDYQLWKEKHLLNIFVQKTEQGDGETISGLSPQKVYLMEVLY